MSGLEDLNRRENMSDVNLSISSALPALKPGQDFPQDHYRALSQFLQRDGAARFLIPALNLCGNEFVLDVGCGEGKVTADLIAPALPNGRIVAVDINPQAIALAQADYGERRSPPIEFIVGDMAELHEVTKLSSARTCKDKFDLICSNFTLHWAKDLDLAFSEMRKLCNDGSRMVHLCSLADPFPELFESAYRVMALSDWSSYFDNGRFRHPTLRSFEDVRVSLEKNSFLIQSGGLQPVWHTFPNEITLAAWVGTMPRPILDRIPEELRPRFGKEVVANYLDALARITDYPARNGREINVRHNMGLFTATAI